MSKVIFHIDLNAFFASAELIRHPEFKGKPMIVAGQTGRSVVATANYEARQWGIHSAMPLYQAKSLCADLVVVDVDHAYYSLLSEQFFTLLGGYTPKLEVASIDECYMDMSDVILRYARPLDLAWEVQNRVFDELGLPCSVGIAPNKFLAKMASDMVKPMGITVLRKKEIEQKLWPLPIESMHGVGQKTAALLKNKGIRTIGDLALEKNERILLESLGKPAYSLIKNARGQGDDELIYTSSAQSLSQSMTMNHDVYEIEESRHILRTLCESLSKRARQKELVGKMISVSLRYYDFHNSVHSLNLDYASDDANIFYENALVLFDKFYEEIPLRLLGVSLGTLFYKNAVVQQLDMFNIYADQKMDILSSLNKAFPQAKLMYASDLLDKEDQDARS